MSFSFYTCSLIYVLLCKYRFRMTTYATATSSFTTPITENLQAPYLPFAKRCLQAALSLLRHKAIPDVADRWLCARCVCARVINYCVSLRPLTPLKTKARIRLTLDKDSRHNSIEVRGLLSHLYLTCLMAHSTTAAMSVLYTKSFS